MSGLVSCPGRGGLRQGFVLVMPVASMVTAATILISMFTPGTVLRALQAADDRLIVLAFLLGAIYEALQAKRASLMLSRHRPVPWSQTFGIQVVSKGLGHLIPLAPATMGLRCLLTSRTTSVSPLSSAGVFLAGGVLDSAALLPLITYLLAVIATPIGLRLLLGGVLVETLLILLVPLLGGSLIALLVRRVAGERVPPRVQPAAQAVEHAVSNVTAVATGEWKSTMLVFSLTICMTALGMLRLALLLGAFHLSVSINQACLLMVVSSLVGRLPVPIPGAGTWASTQALAVAGVVGSGVGGYILVLQAINAIETPILALCFLLWWGMPWNPSTPRWKDLRQTQSSSQAVLVRVETTD